MLGMPVLGLKADRVYDRLADSEAGYKSGSRQV